jgi:hypothetical protein
MLGAAIGNAQSASTVELPTVLFFFSKNRCVAILEAYEVLGVPQLRKQFTLKAFNL